MSTERAFGRHAKFDGRRILVVEEEALVFLMVEDELRGVGATVLGPATCVDGALRLLDAEETGGGIDAAVLDISLQGRSVAPVADRLASLGVPFLFTTGYGEALGMDRHGAAPTLRKPFSPECLVAAVEALPRLKA